MSYIDGVPAEDWIEENRPKNGWYRVYWSLPKKLIFHDIIKGKRVSENLTTGLTDDGSVVGKGSKKSYLEQGYKLKYEWKYKNGKRADGESKGWWPNGQIKQIQTWKDGVPHGPHTAWYDNGNLFAQRYYKNRLEVGLWTYWYETGRKMREGNKKDNKREGLWTFWSPTGNKEKEEFYVNGKFCGKVEGSDKQKYSSIFGAPLPRREWECNHCGNTSQGVIIYYPAADERPLLPFTGIDFSYYEDGKKKSRAVYNEGIQVKLKEWYYHDNGNIKNEWEFVNKNVRDGTWTEWFFIGKKKKVTRWKGNKRHGFRCEWYNTGQIKSKRNWKDNMLNGKSTTWHSNGQKEVESTYKAGAQTGKEFRWYKSGNKCSIETYKNGKLISSKLWRENGNIVE